jgi:DUF4097 and DUF4098 domain-containing protein YvlB
MQQWLGRVACAGVAGLAMLSGASHASAQADFQWRGALAAGQSVEIKGINGGVSASSSGTGQVEVSATRSARRSNPADVRIEVVPHSGGITICAIYPTPPGGDVNRCEPGSGGHSNTRNNDTMVHFEVHVPAGVDFIARTVNGEIEASGLQSDAQGYSVNGSVKLSTTGLASANTVNGSVDVTMGRADWPNGATFKTVNGGITLRLPSVFDADLRADTVNGGISSDFPITVTGVMTPRRLRGTVGSGGRSLTLSTVNGSIRLLKAE